VPIATVRMSLGRLAHRALAGAGARRFPRLNAESPGPRLTAARFINRAQLSKMASAANTVEFWLK